MSLNNLEPEPMIRVTIDFLWHGDICIASAMTDGYTTNVESITMENGEVPSGLDWDMIQVIEMLAVCTWMDEQTTFYLSTETH